MRVVVGCKETGGLVVNDFEARPESSDIIDKLRYLSVYNHGATGSNRTNVGLAKFDNTTKHNKSSGQSAEVRSRRYERHGGPEYARNKGEKCSITAAA